MLNAATNLASTPGGAHWVRAEVEVVAAIPTLLQLPGAPPPISEARLADYNDPAPN